MGQDRLLSDAEVFGTAPAPIIVPPQGLYHDGGHGIAVQIGGDPNAPPPDIAPKPSPPAQGLMSDADVFAGGPMEGDKAQLHPNFGLGFYKGIMKPLDNAAEGLEWLAGRAGLPTAAIDAATGGSAADATAQHAGYIASRAAQGEKPGFWGNLAGNVVGTLPVVAGTGPLAGGAVTGALTTDARTPGGIALDAGIGAAGGKVADGAVSFLKGLISPTVSESAKTLLNEGVRLTPGQIAGGGLRRVEDGATSIPILGDIIKTAQARGMSDFNRAAINRSLAPIGKALPENLPAGNDAVAHAHQALSDAYDEVTPHLSAQVDPQFAENLSNLRALAQNLTGDYARKFENKLQTEVLSRFAPQTGVITGAGLKDAESQLGQEARRFGSVQDGHAQDYADAVRELQSQIRGLAQRQNPEYADRLGAINTGYANLVRVENAASRLGANGGVFTPAQLQGAVRATDNSVRKNATARGTALMQDLATAGKDILPSTVPDSGSPYRHALEGLVALLVGKEANVMPLMMKGAALGATLGAPYTKAGQKIVTPLMTTRPAGADQIADFLAHYKAPAVPAGGAAAVALRNMGSN